MIYFWVLSNRRLAERRGRVQRINATGRYRNMRKFLGSKRQCIDE